MSLKPFTFFSNLNQYFRKIMRLLCIKGHDVINLQIKSIKSFISENCSCQKKIMPEKREDSYQTTSIAWKKMAAKIINVEEYI